MRGAPSVHPSSTAVGDAAELLDVDLDQATNCGAGPGRSAGGTSDRPSGLARLAVTDGPSPDGGDAHREPFGSSGMGPALVDDELGETQASAAVRVALAWVTKTSVVSVGAGSSTPHPEVFVLVQPPRRTQRPWPEHPNRCAPHPRPIGSTKRYEGAQRRTMVLPAVRPAIRSVIAVGAASRPS